MFRRQRPRVLPLGIDLEAQTLLSSSGVKAYWIARRWAEEASSEQMAKDWSGVADAIARKTGKGLGTVIAAIFREDDEADPAKGAAQAGWSTVDSSWIRGMLARWRPDLSALARKTDMSPCRSRAD